MCPTIANILALCKMSLKWQSVYQVRRLRQDETNVDFLLYDENPAKTKWRDFDAAWRKNGVA